MIQSERLERIRVKHGTCLNFEPLFRRGFFFMIYKKGGQIY